MLKGVYPIPATDMTSEEQISYLATKVMGWEKGGEGWTWPWTSVGSHYCPSHDFQPLTDWNHWRSVEMKVMEDDKLRSEYIIQILGSLSIMSRAYLGVNAMLEADLPTRVSALIAAHKELYG